MNRGGARSGLSSRFLDLFFHFVLGVFNAFFCVTKCFLRLIIKINFTLGPRKSWARTLLGVLSGVGFAELLWLSALDKILRPMRRALVSCDQAGGGINLITNDAVRRRREALAAKFRPESYCCFHKRCPDRQRRLGAFETELGVVIETHPHHADYVWCVPGKPAVARCTSLASGGSGEPHRSRSGRGAAI